MRNSEESKFDISKNKDLLIIIVLIVLGFVGLGLFAIFGRNPGLAEVSIDGKVIGKYGLNYDRTLELEGYGGINDILVIENGSVYMKEARCPDGLCIRMGHISMTGQSIVCLPARIMVTIKGKDNKSEIDEISGGIFGE